MKILMVGDVFGEPGVRIAESTIPDFRKKNDIDFCVVNAENASPKGVGLSKHSAAALYRSGADLITLGNHAWRCRDVFALIDDGQMLIRPANFPEGCPGAGAAVIKTAKGNVGVINLLGRLFMDCCDCPFASADRELQKMAGAADVIIIDIHAEASSEKCAIASHTDGRCALVAGTHTHVQTADERIFSKGTAFITDVGMTGPADGIIGVAKDAAVKHFRTLMPERFTPEQGRAQFNAVVVEADAGTGRAVSISRVMLYSDNPR